MTKYKIKKKIKEIKSAKRKFHRKFRAKITKSFSSKTPNQLQAISNKSLELELSTSSLLKIVEDFRFNHSSHLPNEYLHSSELSRFRKMNKRKAEDDEDDFASNKFSKKVDTDDEDDEDEGSDDGKKYEILKEDDIEGQEAGIVTHDGDIMITPFNVEEEMEEGHFDAQGMYHWNKEENIRDNWLENIDWVKIKDQKSSTGEAVESETEEDAQFDEIALYEQILPLMQEKETVAKALRRLGSTKSLSASERLKRKKAGLAYKDSSADAETVTKLTELANKILSRTGNMDIYQETFEEIQKKINATKKKKDIPAKQDAELDMYADDFDEKEKATLTAASTSKDEVELEEPKNQELQWEYKKTLDDDKTEGPYSTVQMNKYMQEDYFKEPVWVRKVGTNSEFYSSRRIDFELYL